MITPRYHREIPQRYRLEAGQCKGCGKVHFPPRRICKECHGREFETVTMPTRGKVLTYTVIDIPPAEFDLMKPYVNAIVELTNGVRLTCMIAEGAHEEVGIGTEVEMVFRRLQTGREWEVLQYGYKARVI